MKYYRTMDNTVSARFKVSTHSKYFDINNIEDFKLALCNSSQSDFSYHGTTINRKNINYLEIFEYNSTHLPDYFGYWHMYKEIVNFNLITDQLETIGKSTFNNMNNFNQEINLPNIIFINNGFISNCYEFDSPIILGNKIKKLGYHYLAINRFKRTNFPYNHNIIFPDSIEYINFTESSSFCYQCFLDDNHYIKLPRNFVNIIRDQLRPYSYGAFSMTREYTMYKRKKIRGITEEDFNELHEMFPDIEDYQQGYYRELIYDGLE